MQDNSSSDDVNDAKILAKFNSLLNKYQNRVRVGGSSMTADAAAAAEVNASPSATEPDPIPTLTEIVLLPPSVIQSQPKQDTPMEHILQAALTDAQINLDTAERKILAHALDARLGERVK